MKPCSSAALCYVNGKQVEEVVNLKSGDRVIFGKSHVFRYNNPEQARKEMKLNASSPISPINDSIASNSTQSVSDSVDWMSAIQELKEKQGIDIKQEMERLLALDEQYKKEVETNKMYKEQIIEYTSKINDLEKKVDIMTKSMMSSSCISTLAGGGVGGGINTSSGIEMESSVISINTMSEDDAFSSPTAANGTSGWTEREYQLALWGAKRWRYHQMTSFRVSCFLVHHKSQTKMNTVKLTT